MSDTVIIRRTVRRDFTTLPNELIRDTRLSWAALGLLVYFLSLPNDFRLRLSHLAKQKTSGRDATRSAAKVLEVAGYLKIRRQRGYHGRFTQTTWEVTDTPDDIVDPGTGRGTRMCEGSAHGDQTMGDRETVGGRLDIDFYIPARLSSADLKSINSVIQTKLATVSKSDVQLMLDELSSAIEGGTIQTTPGQYFAGIASQYPAGKFTPIGAYRVAQRREYGHKEAGSGLPAQTLPTPSHIAQKELALLKQSLEASARGKVRTA